MIKCWADNSRTFTHFIYLKFYVLYNETKKSVCVPNKKTNDQKALFLNFLDNRKPVIYQRHKPFTILSFEILLPLLSDGVVI